MKILDSGFRRNDQNDDREAFCKRLSLNIFFVFHLKSWSHVVCFASFAVKGFVLMTENQLSKIILDAVFKVHKALGPGLLESAYEACLVRELRKTGLEVENQYMLPVRYEDVCVDAGYRVDVLVEGKVILELKAVEQVVPIHQAQLLPYLKLSGCRLGFLLNFNVMLMKEGIKRMVNGL